MSAKKANAGSPPYRRASWGGDVTQDFDQLKRLYAPPSPAEGGGGEREEDDAEEKGIKGKKNVDNELEELGVPESEAYLYTNVDGGGRLKLASMFKSLISVLASCKARSKRVEADEDGTAHESPRTPEAVDFTKFKYINGPQAAAATKSFRHTLPTQQFNSSEVTKFKTKNFKYMSTHLREQQLAAERGVELEREPTEEEKAMRRGYAAAMRQYQGGNRSKSQLIKAYSYGSGARHTEDSS